MATPTWIAASLANVTVGGSPAGSEVQKTSGGSSLYNATARTTQQLAAVGDTFECTVDAANLLEIGLTTVTDDTDLLVVANYVYITAFDSTSIVTVRHGASYHSDFVQTTGQRNTLKFEIFDAGSGNKRVRTYLNGVLKHTDNQNLTLPIGIGVLMRTSGAYIGGASITTSGTNTAPVVSAGSDVAIETGGTATLTGSVTDDGLPSGTLTATWSKVSGPGTVTFGNPNLAATTATVSMDGTYVLRLTGNDGALSATDDVTLTSAPAATHTFVAESLQNVTISDGNSRITKTAGSTELYNGTARTTQFLTGAGSYVEAEIDSADILGFGLTNTDVPANLSAFVNYPFVVSFVGTTTAEARPGNVYAGDIALAAGRNTVRIELFDSGGGNIRAKVYVGGVLRHTSAVNLLMPVAAGWVIRTRDAYADNIALSGSAVTNQAPVVSAGVDRLIIAGGTATLAGSATDDGNPSGTLTVTWSKVTGPGSVTFGNANAAETTATVSLVGTYVLRLTATDGTLTSTDEMTLTVVSAPDQPSSGSAYSLRTDDDIEVLPPLPVMGPAGTYVVDPTFLTRQWRVTDATTASNGRSWNTPSAPNLNAWASDDSRFYIIDENGSNTRIYNFHPSLEPPFSFHSAPTFVSEPCFARAITKPTILYAPYYNYTVVAYDLTTGQQTTLITLTNEVGPLSQSTSATYPRGSYTSIVYASQLTSASFPERICISYGDIQDLHRYMTVFEADNPSKRVTVNTYTSQIKINGGAWQTLLKPDGTAANINFGLHSISIDRTGQWVKFDIAGTWGGAAHTAVFNTVTNRLHEWTSNAWLGHYSWGFGQHVTCIGDPDGGGQMQWLLTDMADSGLPPDWRPLIVPPFTPSEHSMTDHNSWNNARADALVPFLSATQRGIAAGDWNTLHDEYVLVSTAPVPGHRFYRAGHHRMAAYDSTGAHVWTFRDTMRPQINHAGTHAVSTTNWGLSLGTFGAPPKNHRRDVVMLELWQYDVEPPPPDPEPPIVARRAPYIRIGGQDRTTRIRM